MARSRNKFTRETARQQMVDAVGSDQIEYQLDSGETLHWPHPMFYPRSVRDDLLAVDEDTVDSRPVARALLGKEQMAKLTEQFDGDEDDAADEVVRIVGIVQRESTARMNGRPTRS